MTSVFRPAMAILGLAALVGCGGMGNSTSNQGRAFGSDPLGTGNQAARNAAVNAYTAANAPQVAGRVVIASVWPEGELEEATQAFQRALNTAHQLDPRPSAIVVVDPSGTARIGGTVAKERGAWSSWEAKFHEFEWNEHTVLVPVPHLRSSDSRALDIAQWFYALRPKTADPTALEERDEPEPWNGVIPLGPRAIIVAEYAEKESPEAIAIELGTAEKAEPAVRAAHRIYTRLPKPAPEKTKVVPIRTGREPALLVLTAYSDGRVVFQRGELLGPAIDRLPKDQAKTAPLSKEEPIMTATPPRQTAVAESPAAKGG